MSEKVKIGVIQLRQTGNKLDNVKSCERFIEMAARDGAKMAFLPENFDFFCDNKEQLWELSESLNGDLINKYRDMARKNNVFLSLGGFHRKAADNDAAAAGGGGEANKMIFNTHVVIGNDGDVRAVYDKLHLFDLDLPAAAGVSSTSFKESDRIEKGTTLVPPVDTPVGRMALAICYDMRFPEQARSMREMGAAVLTYPSAFTVPTGQAHWHALLRARAIDNQCFVVAAAQEGQHNPKRITYGHSLVIDPWGSIIAERSEPGPGLLMCDIDLGLINTVRSRIPIMGSRRLDLFPSCSMELPRFDIGNESFQFGCHVIKPSCVFYRSILSFAFVNISPLVPGHVLVSPIRKVTRFAELSSMEVMDLYAVVKRISSKLTEYFDAHSLTISQQDGPDAGQSVAHVHIHVLPRKPGDFARNDDIYQSLQNHDKPENLARKYRNIEEMSKEAGEFRKLFY